MRSESPLDKDAGTALRLLLLDGDIALLGDHDVVLLTEGLSVLLSSLKLLHEGHAERLNLGEVLLDDGADLTDSALDKHAADQAEALAVGRHGLEGLLDEAKGGQSAELGKVVSKEKIMERIKLWQGCKRGAK